MTRGIYYRSRARLSAATLAPYPTQSVRLQVPSPSVLESDQAPVEAIEEVIAGNVLSAGHIQNLLVKSALEVGLPMTTPAYTVNMVWEWLEQSMKAIPKLKP